METDLGSITQQWWRDSSVVSALQQHKPWHGVSFRQGTALPRHVPATQQLLSGTHHTGFSLGSLLPAEHKHHFTRLPWWPSVVINVLVYTSSLPSFQRANEFRSRIKLGKMWFWLKWEATALCWGFLGIFFFWCSTSSGCQSYNGSKTIQEPSTTII